MSGQVRVEPGTAEDPHAEYTRASRTLAARSRKVLLTVHVSVATGLIGADLALLTLAVSGWRGSEAVSVYPAMNLVSTWVVAPLAVTALVTGVLQGLMSPYGLLRYWWVTLKLAITLILTGLVLFVVVPRLRGAADSALAEASEGFTGAQPVVYVMIFALAVAAIALMGGLAVYKPRWRMRSPHRS
jgi:hypothetical protein